MPISITTAEDLDAIDVGESAPTPERPRLDEAALHGALGEFVRKISPHTEADPAAVLMQTLVSLGCYVGRTAHYRLGRDTHYANLFCLIVGPTGRGRKGMSWSESVDLLRQIDPAFLKNNKVTGLSSGEGLIERVKDAQYEPERVKENGMTVDTRMVVAHPGVEDKRLLVVEPEFGRTLKVIERESNILSAVVRDAYDTGNLCVLTKHALRASDAHISIIGHITPEELRAQLSSVQVSNGWANRFVYIWSERSQLLPFGGQVETGALAIVLQTVACLRDHGSSAGAIEMDAEAKNHWRTIYEQMTNGKAGVLGTVLGRADANTCRLALLYALLDGSDRIRLPHLQAATPQQSAASIALRMLQNRPVRLQLNCSVVSIARTHRAYATAAVPSLHRTSSAMSYRGQRCRSCVESSTVL